MANDKLVFHFDADDKQLSAAVERAEARLERLARVQTNLEGRFKRGEISAGAFNTAINRTGALAQSQVKGLERLGVTLDKTSRAYNQFGDPKSGKGSGAGNAGLALQELGRGFADFKVVGGFNDLNRGLIASTNNIERFVEITRYTITQSGGFAKGIGNIAKSFLGPAGFVFALTVALQYLPEFIAYIKGIDTDAEDAAKAIRELNDAILQQQGFDFDPNEKGYEKAQEQIKNLTDEINKLESLEGSTRGAGQGATYIYTLNEEETKRLETLKAQRAELQGLIQDGRDHFTQTQKEREEREKILEAAKKQKEIDKINADALAKYQEMRDNEALSDDEIDARLGDALREARDAIEFEAPDFVFVDPDVIDDEISALEDLQSALVQTGSMMANLSDEASMKWAEANEQFEKSRVTVESASDSLISAFESAATQGGNLIQNLAGGILSAIGSMLIKEGSAYIALGIARNAAFPGSGKKVIASGAGLVAAGVGLKAAGSSVARSGRGSGGSSSSAAAGSRPTERVGDTTSSNVVEFKIGNGALIGQVQQALDKRGTTHGSSRLFPNRRR